MPSRGLSTTTREFPLVAAGRLIIAGRRDNTRVLGPTLLGRLDVRRTSASIGGRKISPCRSRVKRSLTQLASPLRSRWSGICVRVKVETRRTKLKALTRAIAVRNRQCLTFRNRHFSWYAQASADVVPYSVPAPLDVRSNPLGPLSKYCRLRGRHTSCRTACTVTPLEFRLCISSQT